MYRSTPSPLACVRLALVALSAVALTRCAEPPAAPPAAPAAPTTPLADFAPVPSAPITSEYKWESGEPAVWMGALAGRACFLTYIGGKFDGATDWVAVTGNFGGWYLSGASAGSGFYGVRARARCVAATAYSAEQTVKATASQPYDAIELTPGACGLTRVGGKLAKGNDWVLINANVTHPALAVGSASAASLTASARCVQTPGLELTVTKTWWYPETIKTVASVSSVDFCVLGFVAGPFRDVIHLVHLAKVSPSWTLDGSGSTDTRATAYCFEA